MKKNKKNNVIRNIVLTILIIVVPFILKILLPNLIKPVLEKIYNCYFDNLIFIRESNINRCSSNVFHIKYLLQFIVDIIIHIISVGFPIFVILILKKTKEHWGFYIVPVIRLIYTSFLMIIFILTIFESIGDNGRFSVDYIYGVEFNYLKKPIIYIYPEEKMDLSIKLVNKDIITHSYPKYENQWNINIDTNGNIYDYKTKRKYYALYWEGKENDKVSFNEGFIVKGTNTVKFLEEKLAILGLNEREINEFIVYWVPLMENNKYNIIRFKTNDEINDYMPIEISKKPDTLIRVYMDFKASNKKVNIKEQKLEKKIRKGFTIVEWGGSEIN